MQNPSIIAYKRNHRGERELNTIFEQKGGRCVQNGDYLFPDPTLPDEGHWTIGKYGRMRQAYLKEHHPRLYSRLILYGKLNEYLAEVERICQERLKTMIPQMAKQQGVTEELKARDQLGWVGRMNEIQQ